MPSKAHCTADRQKSFSGFRAYNFLQPSLIQLAAACIYSISCHVSVMILHTTKGCGIHVQQNMGGSEKVHDIADAVETCVSITCAHFGVLLHVVAAILLHYGQQIRLWDPMVYACWYDLKMLAACLLAKGHFGPESHAFMYLCHMLSNPPMMLQHKAVYTELLMHE